MVVWCSRSILFRSRFCRSSEKGAEIRRFIINGITRRNDDELEQWWWLSVGGGLLGGLSSRRTWKGPRERLLPAPSSSSSSVDRGKDASCAWSMMGGDNTLALQGVEAAAAAHVEANQSINRPQEERGQVLTTTAAVDDDDDVRETTSGFIGLYNMG